MKSKISSLLIGIVAVAVLGTALYAAAPTNVMITDEGVGLIQWFQQISIFQYDVAKHLINDKPIVILRNKKLHNPLELLLPAGDYQIMVKVSFIPELVPFCQFTVPEQGKVTCDLFKVKFPKELQTY